MGISSSGKDVNLFLPICYLEVEIMEIAEDGTNPNLVYAKMPPTPGMRLAAWLRKGAK